MMEVQAYHQPAADIHGPIVKIAFSVLSGILLALAFPNFNLFWLAWFALVPFFLVLSQSRRLRTCLWLCFCFAIPFFSLHLFWLVSLFPFVGWWSVFGLVGLVVFQTLFILLFGLLFYFSRRLFSNNLFVQGLLVALAWSVVEWLRAYGPFGLPSGVVGYSQVQILPLIQIASLFDVYGVSFLVVFFNLSIVAFLQNDKNRSQLIFAILIVILAVGFGNWQLVDVPPQAKTNSLKLALIQPNIEQEDKLDSSKVEWMFERQTKMTRLAAKEGAKVVIWPETAVFTYLINNQNYLTRLKQLAQTTKTWLLIGTPYYDRDGSYNSLVCLTPSGQIVGRYDKQRLVPFGEYLPWREVLYPFLRQAGYFEKDYKVGPARGLIVVAEKKVAPAICFESTFPDTIERKVKKDTSFILTVTNDAWFGDSSAPYFHLDTDIFRAVENRKYFVQVGNTGFSAVIDPFGRVLKKSQLNQQQILFFDLVL